jgi:hypothetical protein
MQQKVLLLDKKKYNRISLQNKAENQGILEYVIFEEK